LFFTKTVLKPTRTRTQNKEKHNFGLMENSYCPDSPSLFLSHFILLVNSHKNVFFSVFGRQADKSGQLMVTLNFSSILTKKCEDSDYTTWTPVNKVGSKNIG